MTPHEEKLVLELHSQWGNRWSKIARRLPGRTDNEIKNYWRTHMRKKAQERKQPTISPPSSSSSSLSNCSSSISSNNETYNTKATTDDITAGSCCSTHQGARIPADLQGKKNPLQEGDDEEVYTLDDIWKAITSSESQTIKPVYNSETATTTFNCPPLAASPWWDYNTGMMMWSSLDDEVLCKNMYNDPFLSSYGAL